MMELYCQACKEYNIEPESHMPFGEEGVCPVCGWEYEVDHDYSGEGYDLSFWTVPRRKLEGHDE